MRLGFVSARFCARSGDTLVTDVGVGRLVDELHRRSPSLRVALSVSDNPRRLDEHELSLPPSQFVALPWMPSVREGFHQVIGSARALRSIRESTDVVIVQLPFTAPFALLNDSGPTVFHVCADQREIVRTSKHYSGLARFAALTVAETTDVVQRWAARDARAVTHGSDLLRRYGQGRGRAIVSSSLLREEVESVMRERPMEGRFRVLFVGYMRPEKGFDVLVDAMTLLHRELRDVELRVVGADAMHDRGMRASLDRARVTLGDGFQHVGPRTFGPDLFREFADADVLTLPSLSEGTPRVLVEARAFGCPVVATRVGGIPDSVTHELDGLLVPPNDPYALAAALERIARNPELRARLSERGLERARSCTVSAVADALLAEAEQALTHARAR